MVEPRDDDPEFIPSRRVIEALSWRVAAELVRRHPSRLEVVETFPADGFYDTLTVRDRRGSEHGHIDLNRIGTAHVHHRFDDARGDHYHRYHGFWGSYLANDPKEVLKALERRAGLPAPNGLPASTSYSLSIRFAAACLAPTAFGIHDWCWQGPLYPLGSPRTELVDAFSAVTEIRSMEPSPLHPERTDGYWFLQRDWGPVIALDTKSARCWDLDGNETDLMGAYVAAGRRLWPVVNAVLGDQLG